ncbi:MAG: non-homologous end-joining DNA ligase, partial [Myxococcota bacterium]
MPDLRRYREKRDPDKTPEPFGEASSLRRVGPGARRAFVVQQHAARRMHWDLRLEIEGVLVSWAIPRGPTLDPKERRLAVRTEDHPLEYANFEGIIPAGNYGAGAMIVWDSGSYNTVDGSVPSDGLDKGKLDLVFEGHKLRGRFALVRTRGEDGRQWLLLRKGDPPVDSAELVDAEPESVLSGLTVADLEGGVSRVEEVRARSLAAGASPERHPDPLDRWKRLRPMLASKREDPFTDRRWLFELKYDGFRALALKTDDRVRLQSRTGRDFTATYREVSHALSHLPVDRLVLDGEIVSLDAQGRSSFERLQQRFKQTDADSLDRAPLEIPVVFYAFDLLFASDYDLRRCPLSIRKEILSCVVPRAGLIRYADHVEGDGEALFGAAHQHGLEGVVAKRSDAPYETGRRSKTWVKIKVPRAAHLVIVGFVPGQGSRKPLGSLMLAWNDEQGLVYAGNAGSGLGESELDELVPLLEASRVPEPLFAGAPAPGARGAVYVRPLHVVEISFTEVTRSGRLRHPVFVRLDPDRAPDECRAPAERAEPETLPEAPPPAGPELALTRLDKVFWPLEGYTKGDLLEYYEAAWPWIAPYLRDRPVVLTRYPDGIEGKHFYQKNAPEFTPDWVEREQIEGTDYFICNDLKTLLYVINSGAIPLHVWSARRTSIE